MMKGLAVLPISLIDTHAEIPAWDEWEELNESIGLPVKKLLPFPLRVCVDTREGAPYRFLNIDPWSFIDLHHIGLKTGDYSIVGLEDLVTIERKSVADLLGSITAGRDRFEREFQRMQEMEFAAVVIEGEFSEVLGHISSSTKMNPKTLPSTIDAWTIRYPRVHWKFCMNRRHAEIQTLRLLYRFWKNRDEINHPKKKRKVKTDE